MSSWVGGHPQSLSPAALQLGLTLEDQDPEPHLNCSVFIASSVVLSPSLLATCPTAGRNPPLPTQSPRRRAPVSARKGSQS